MTNRDFAIASNKLFYFAMNFPSDYITYPTLWNGDKTEVLPTLMNAFDPHSVEHMVEKWKHAYDKYGSYGVFFGFYSELDGTNRVKVLNYINENYKMSDTYGLSKELMGE